MSRPLARFTGPLFLVGLGRVGTALGVLLQRRGVPVVGGWSRSGEGARRARRYLRVPTYSGPFPRAIGEARVLLVATPDSAIPVVARRLSAAELGGPGQVALHTAGALDSSALAPLRRRGVAVGCLHPAFPFASIRAAVEKGCGSAFLIEGDPAAVRAARRLVRILGGRPVRVSPGGKPLYHAGLVLGSNYIVALCDAASELLRLAGVPGARRRAILLPLLQGTIMNVARFGPERALTGPIARGDVETVRAHLRALHRAAPDRLPLYRALGGAALALARRGRRLGGPRARALRAVLGARG